MFPFQSVNLVMSLLGVSVLFVQGLVARFRNHHPRLFFGFDSF